MTRKAHTFAGGLSLEYSPVNCAWFVLWHDQVLAVKTEEWEARAYIDDLLRPSTHS